MFRYSIACIHESSTKGMPSGVFLMLISAVTSSAFERHEEEPRVLVLSLLLHLFCVRILPSLCIGCQVRLPPPRSQLYEQQAHRILAATSLYDLYDEYLRVLGLGR